MPHLAALAILYVGHGQTQADTMQVTAPAETAGLIDQLRAFGITLIYDSDTQTLCTAESVAVTLVPDR